MECKKLPGISMLRIIVSRGKAYEKGDVRVKFFFNGTKTCLTDNLETYDKDFMEESDNIFRTKTLGACLYEEINEDDLRMENGTSFVEVEVINEEYEFTVSAIEFFVNLEGESQRFVCHLDWLGIKVNNLQSPR